MKIKDPRMMHDFVNGVLEGKDVVTSKKLLKDARHFYENGDCDLSDDTVMYEVYMFSDGDPKTVGNLNWGLSLLKPVYVNGECNITRGHFHADTNFAEIYMCFAGEGLLLYMDENAKCWAEKMTPGSVHHIDGKYAHRLVNTGEVDLKIGCCWPTTAGHDYARVEKMPFSARVFKENGEIIIKE